MRLSIEVESSCYLQSSTKIVRRHPLLFTSVNVDRGYLAATACKFALKTLLRITTLTEVGGEIIRGKKNIFLLQKQGSIESLGFVMLDSIYFVKDCRQMLQRLSTYG